MLPTRLLLIGAFLLLLSLPGLQMRFRFVQEVPLSGVAVKPTEPSLTLGAWWRGELQSQAEDWLDEHIGFRGHAVRTDNQIGLSVFREASSKASDSVLLGRRMMVYGDAYVTAYDGTSDFSDQRIRKRVRGLDRLQDALTRRGPWLVRPAPGRRIAGAWRVTTAGPPGVGQACAPRRCGIRGERALRAALDVRGAVARPLVVRCVSLGARFAAPKREIVAQRMRKSQQCRARCRR